MAAGRPPGDLDALRARLETILDPYRDRLEPATIYSIPTLRRHGAKAQEWFAFVKPASRHVGFFLLPVSTWPDLRNGLSPELAKHLTGKATFTFSSFDEGLLAELEGLVARAFDRYLGAGDTGVRRPLRSVGPAVHGAAMQPSGPARAATGARAARPRSDLG